MASTVEKFPVKTHDKGKGLEPQSLPKSAAWHPIERLRREIDRLFDDIDRSVWRTPFSRSLFELEPFWRRELSWGPSPAVDIVEREKDFEITAEAPGMDQSNMEVTLANGTLIIKGEKSEEKEEKKKNAYLSERRYGSFQRAFHIPDGVDVDRIEATFSRGVLKVVLPKTAEAQSKEKKITVKAA